jgi:hypothetical protein
MGIAFGQYKKRLVRLLFQLLEPERHLALLHFLIQVTKLLVKMSIRKEISYLFLIVLE